MTDTVEKVARAWASMDGKPCGEGYVEDAAFLLRRSGVGRRIEEMEEMLMSATVDGYDMAKNEYRSRIEDLEAKLSESEALLAKAVEAERERCAQVAENVATCILPSGHFLSERVAIAIRESTGQDRD